MYHALIEQYQRTRHEVNVMFFMLLAFLAIYFLPIGQARFDNAVLEAIQLTHWYAREHVVLCLLPAFVIAGAMAAFMSQGAVMRYLGPASPKPVALGVASISGMLLAVCSCTVLPLFGGIYKRGAGLGAAIAFLYAGPAINVMAVVVTAKILGVEMGIARALGAVLFALLIGALMHLIYRSEEALRAQGSTRGFGGGQGEKPTSVIAALFALLVGVLVFANWPAAQTGIWLAIYEIKWGITACLGLMLAGLLVWQWGWSIKALAWLIGAIAAAAAFFPHTPELPVFLAVSGLLLIASQRDSDKLWASESWGFAKQILPLLLGGVFIAGFALGRPESEGIIPASWVAAAVGDNGLASTVVAALLGALMYFSTLTEVPIVEALLGAGMGKGPALALLLAGPALSLPNMLVIRTILGTKKTLVYCALVVVMATAAGLIYGNFW